MAKKSAKSAGGKDITAKKKGSEKKKGGGNTAKAAQPVQGPEGVGGKITQLKEFFEESKVEIKKVTWPSRKETITTSIAVVVLTIVMSIYLGVVDLALAKVIKFILS